MAESDISGEQWLELYHHLLQRLEELKLGNVSAEIEAAASAPIFEDKSSEKDDWINKIMRREVGKIFLRPRSAEEVFSAALGVLSTRLIELPAIADAISKYLGRQAKGIEFRVDYMEQYAPRKSEPVSLERLTISSQEKESIDTALNRLGIPIDRFRKR